VNAWEIFQYAAMVAGAWMMLAFVVVFTIALVRAVLRSDRRNDK